MAALFELSPDVTVGQPLHYLEVGPHGFLTVARTFGTLFQGGEFETVLIYLASDRGDRILGAEVFELEDVDAARARFAALAASAAP
jgi:hypothetical protein